jgi:UDP:flavonoid glycosyltransferase YjiC (YdhE family)
MPGIFAPLERLVRQGLRHAALRYDRLWIPDLPGENNLSGELSRKYPLPSNHRFIGPLSRLSRPVAASVRDLDLLVLLSGPEPQRTLFERRLREQLGRFGGKAVVLLGTPGGCGRHEGNVAYVPHVSTKELGRLLSRARAVVCRGGYTTIMELVSLGVKAVLVPTPGQTEQEYLARHLRAKGYFAVQRQARFDLDRALGALDKIDGPPPLPPDGELLREAVEELVGSE